MTENDDSEKSVVSSSSQFEHGANDPVYLFEKEQQSRRTESLTRSHSRNSILLTARSLTRVITGEEDVREFVNYGKEIPSMGGGKELPATPGDRDKYLVLFEGDNDPMHPHNWPLCRKIYVGVVVTLFSFCNSMGSALLSESNESIQKRFSVGREIATLVTSLYVLGFACGPIVWGPLSELFGRRSVFLPAIFGYSCFSYAVATSENIQTLTICRFFCGFFGGSAMVLSASTMSDMFSQKFRGRAMVPFGLSICCGPCLAPIISGFTEKNSALGWRFNAYWTAFISSFIFILMLFSKETYHPVILAKKAKLIRDLSGNWAVHAPQETLSLSFTEILVRYIARPLYMLTTEPILLLFLIYAAFVYGLIYLLLTAIPIIFEGNYKFVQGVCDLPYISILIGCVFGGLALFCFDLRYRSIVERGIKPLPRERLPAMMLAAFSVTGGLFWMSWTGDFPDSIPWIVPTIGAGLVGFGFLTILQPCINYVVDVYLQFAASGLAAMTLLRSIFGGVFPLFAHAMYTNLGIKYAGTLLGCVSALLIPVPFLFYKFDERIRSKSKLAAS